MNLIDGWGWREAMKRLFGRRRESLGELCLELGLDDTWSAVVRRTPIEVRCVLGLALITCEGDTEDHVLSDGATFVATKPGRLAIWALQRARLRVATVCETAPDRDGKGLVGEKGGALIRSCP